MIVKCEQCQTRFKIPDDKVTDKGVKVRCTKCSHTFRVTRDMASEGAAPPPPSGDDPFARFGAVGSGGAASAGRAASPMSVTGALPPAPSLDSMLPPLPSAPNPMGGGAFDFGGLAPPPAVVPIAPGVPAPPAVPSPFDFANLVPPTRGAAPAAPFDFGALGSPPGGQAPGASPMTVRVGGPPPPPPPSAPTGQAPAFDFAALGAPPGGAPPPKAAANPFGEPTHGGALADPFGGPPAASPFGPPPSGPRATGRAAAHDPFAPTPSRAQAGQAAADAKTAVHDAPTAVGAAAFPGGADDVDPLAFPSAPEPAKAVAVGKLRPSAPPALKRAAADESSKPRTVVAVVVNVGIAAVLVAALFVVFSVVANEGKFDGTSLSPERLKALVADPSEFVAQDVSNGLYETKSGRAVFFVRGEVMNTGSSTSRVKVRAEILEGGSLVRAVEGFAGPAPTPEELRALSSPDELEHLLSQQGVQAKPLEPGASAPFVVAFFEYPPDLKAFRIRVAASAEAKAAGGTP